MSFRNAKLSAHSKLERLMEVDGDETDQIGEESSELEDDAEVNTAMVAVIAFNYFVRCLTYPFSISHLGNEVPSSLPRKRRKSVVPKRDHQ